MTQVQVAYVRTALAAAVTFLGFFLLGYGGILVSAGLGHSVAVVWPATAFGMCMLLRLSRNGRTDAVLLTAILLAGLLANGLQGDPVFETVSYSVINVLEVLAGVLVTRRFAVPRFRTMGATLRFALAAGLAPALFGAALAGLFNRLTGNADWLDSGTQWFFANLLGFCMLFPLGITLSWHQFAKLCSCSRRASWRKAVLLFMRHS